MADMRRNIAHRRRVVGEWPRTVLILFFAFCAVTYGAAISWQMIIESDNEYLETAAALVTVLLIGGVSIYVYRRIRAYRQGLNELRQAHPLSPGANDDQGSVQLRLYLQQIYGRSVDVDTLLSRAGSVSTQIIDTLVRSYSYSAEGKTSLIHDVELGITRTNTVSTTSQHISSSCDDMHCENAVDSSSFDSVKCAEEPSVEMASLRNSSIPTECSVCLMEYKEGEVLSELPCRHIYHRSCVTEWLLLQNACPMCKQPLFVLPPVPVPVLLPAPGQPHGVNAGTDGCGLVVDTAIALDCVAAASTEETRAPELPPLLPSCTPAPVATVMPAPLASQLALLQVVDLEEEV